MYLPGINNLGKTILIEKKGLNSRIGSEAAILKNMYYPDGVAIQR